MKLTLGELALHAFPIRNLVVFSDAQSGDGVEAWVTSKADDMAKLEVDEEDLLANYLFLQKKGDKRDFCLQAFMI